MIGVVNIEALGSEKSLISFIYGERALFEHVAQQYEKADS